MKIVILAGGFGTRISEESHLKPKPMIEIGGSPILIHIMKYYSSYGFNEFIICLGYKGYVIKEYFNNLHLHLSDVTYDYSTNTKPIFFNSKTYNWKVSLIDTGLNTMTGGRLKRISHLLKDENFMVTYGDGLSNVDLPSLIDFHSKNKKILTLTAVNPEGRFGLLGIKDEQVINFSEKPKSDDGWINGGFMVANSKLFNYIPGDETILERSPFETLAKENQLMAFKHYGFWQPMDTLRDKELLEKLNNSKEVPWKR
jgi:glucose-1-phosphate cytidylyltransferase